MEAASAIGKAKNDNNRQTVEQKNCDLDTCSISTTVPCTRGSRASSHISIPGLDWDSQVKLILVMGGGNFHIHLDVLTIHQGGFGQCCL